VRRRNRLAVERGVRQTRFDEIQDALSHDETVGGGEIFRQRTGQSGHQQIHQRLVNRRHATGIQMIQLPIQLDDEARDDGGGSLRAAK